MWTEALSSKSIVEVVVRVGQLGWRGDERREKRREWGVAADVVCLSFCVGLNGVEAAWDISFVVWGRGRKNKLCAEVTVTRDQDLGLGNGSATL